MRTILPPARFGLTLVAIVLLAMGVMSPAPAVEAPETTVAPQPGPSEQPATTTTTVPSGPVTMDVSAGLDGLVAVDAPMIVDIELGARQLFVGTLELEFRGATAMAVQVPAGGVKQYRLESPAAGRGALSYTVTLRDEAGDEVAVHTGRARRPETEVVGLLGIEGIDTALRSARTTPLQRTPEVIRLDPDRIDARIAPVGYIVAGPGAVTRLTDEARATLSGWVRDGGRLLATGADIAEIAEPTGAAVLAGTGIALTRLGDGELGLVPVPEEVTAEEWSLILRDTPGGLDILDSADMGFDGGLLVAASSGQEAAVPALPWLLGGILLFVVLVGPVNLLVLRAVGKPEWSWVTIPLVSLLFLVGFWVVGKSQIIDYTANHATVVVDDGRAGAVQDTGLLVQVATAGEHVLALGDGWHALPTGTGEGAAMVEGVVDEGTVVFDLEDLGLGATRLRSEGDRVGLEATVAPTEDGLEVTVTNETPWTLGSWGAVVDGRGFGSRDPLGPGETASVTVVAGRAALAEPAIVVAAMSTGEVDPELVRLLGGHLESTWPALADDASYVFGVTSDRMVEVDVDGRATESPGMTLLVRRFELADSDRLELGSVVPELLSVDGASSIERYAEEIYVYGADAIVLLYRVPGGVPDAAAVGSLSGQFDVVEIWDWTGARWVPFEWERSIDPTRHLSAGGEMLLRASAEDTEQFVDAPLRLQQYALRWTA